MGQIPPASRAERYRRRAKELRAIARAMKNADDAQRELFVIARQYEKLADKLRRLGRGR
jgi:hypothetical protein